MTGVIDRIRRPEYTGDNRCVPCTVVNVVIAAVAGLIAGVIVPVAGFVVFAVALVIIYLRGYLVPGTPTLTQKYLPARVLDAFDKEPAPRDTPTWDAIERHKQRKKERIEPETYLIDNGIIEPTEDGHVITPSFDSQLTAETDAVNGTTLWWNNGAVGCEAETLAELLDADPDEIEPQDKDHPAIRVGPRVRQWPSAPALGADVAANRAIKNAVSDWKAVPLEQRLELLSAVRSFRERCPCGGPLAQTVDTIDSCCRSGKVTARRCESCGETLVEYGSNAPAWFSPKSR